MDFTTDFIKFLKRSMCSMLTACDMTQIFLFGQCFFFGVISTSVFQWVCFYSILSQMPVEHSYSIVFECSVAVLWKNTHGMPIFVISKMFLFMKCKHAINTNFFFWNGHARFSQDSCDSLTHKMPFRCWWRSFFTRVVLIQTRNLSSCSLIQLINIE